MAGKRSVFTCNIVRMTHCSSMRMSRRVRNRINGLSAETQMCKCPG